MTISAPTSDAHREQVTAIEGQGLATTSWRTARAVAPVRAPSLARFAFEDYRVDAGAVKVGRRPWPPDVF